MDDHGDIIIYQTEDGLTKIDVSMQDEKVVVAEFATTTRHGAMEGKTQNNITRFYNLDVIISVGYRVRSQRGVQFRIWATSILKEHIKKGFAMDDDRLKGLGVSGNGGKWNRYQFFVL